MLTEARLASATFNHPPNAFFFSRRFLVGMAGSRPPAPAALLGDVNPALVAHRRRDLAWQRVGGQLDALGNDGRLRRERRVDFRLQNGG